MPRLNPVPAAVAVVIVLAGAGRAAADTYRDEALRFTVELPAGWQVMPAAELKQNNEFVRSRHLGTGEVVQYRAGFRPPSTALHDRSTFALVQFVPGPTDGKTAEVVAREVNQAARGQTVKEFRGRLSGVLADLSVGSAGVDRDRNWVVFRMAAATRTGQRVESLSVGHVGPDGVVMVHSYFDPARKALAVAAVERLNESFRFDPAPGGPAGFDWQDPASGSDGGRLLPVGVGVTAALGVALVLSVRRR